MPKDNAMGTGQTREGQALEKAGELLGKLPPDYVEDDYSSRVSAMGGLEVPLNMFLFQEVQRMAVVVAYTRHTLTLLSEALRGDVVMTAQLQETLDCLVDGQPPRSWLFDAKCVPRRPRAVARPLTVPAQWGGGVVAEREPRVLVRRPA